MTTPRLVGVGALALVLVSSSCKDRGADDGSHAPDSPTSEQGPSSDELTELCEHNYEILVASAGAGSPAVHEAFVSSCRTNSAARRETLGEAAWAERKRCVLAAEDADALGICDGRQPRPESEPADIVDAGIDIDRLCRHLVDILEREMQAQGGAQLWSKEEHDMLMRSCHEEFTKTRREDPQTFERQARCMLAAEKIEQFQGCQ